MIRKRCRHFSLLYRIRRILYSEKIGRSIIPAEKPPSHGVHAPGKQRHHPLQKRNIHAVTQAIDSLQRRSGRRCGQKQKIRSERAVGKKRRNGQRLQGQQHLRRTVGARPFSHRQRAQADKHDERVRQHIAGRERRLPAADAAEGGVL